MRLEELSQLATIGMKHIILGQSLLKIAHSHGVNIRFRPVESTVEPDASTHEHSGELGAFLTAWRIPYGSKSRSSLDVARDCRSETVVGIVPLSRFVRSLCERYGHQFIEAGHIGTFLHRHEGQAAKGFVIERAGTTKGKALWRVVPEQQRISR
jgi:hypothetical protein